MTSKSLRTPEGALLSCSAMAQNTTEKMLMHRARALLQEIATKTVPALEAKRQHWDKAHLDAATEIKCDAKKIMHLKLSTHDPEAMLKARCKAQDPDLGRIPDEEAGRLGRLPDDSAVKSKAFAGLATARGGVA